MIRNKDLNFRSMKLSRIIFTLWLLFLNLFVSGQDQIKVYPTNWWSGMKNKQLQLMIRSPENLPKQVTINYPGVTVQKIYQPVNKHYLFIDLMLSSATKPGKFSINILNAGPVSYELK